MFSLIFACEYKNVKCFILHRFVIYNNDQWLKMTYYCVLYQLKSVICNNLGCVNMHNVSDKIESMLGFSLTRFFDQKSFIISVSFILLRVSVIFLLIQAVIGSISGFYGVATYDHPWIDTDFLYYIAAAVLMMIHFVVYILIALILFQRSELLRKQAFKSLINFYLTLVRYVSLEPLVIGMIGIFIGVGVTFLIAGTSGTHITTIFWNETFEWTENVSREVFRRDSVILVRLAGIFIIIFGIIVSYFSYFFGALILEVGETLNRFFRRESSEPIEQDSVEFDSNSSHTSM